MDTATIYHIRPGKRTQVFKEGFVSEDEHGLTTLSILSDEDSKSLTKRLLSQDLINPDDVIHSVAKYYSFNEHFNLLVFGGPDSEVLGYYSDIAMPLRKVGSVYEILDLFLDIWLKPDGTLLELDLDEFQDAISKGLVTTEQQEIALIAFERLKTETKQGIYPQRYIRS